MRWDAYAFTDMLELAYSIHNLLPGLIGYLILFATQAFVPQRQSVHRGSPSPLHIPPVSKHSIATPVALICILSHMTLAYKYHVR